jgi:hypothetical protein
MQENEDKRKSHQKCVSIQSRKVYDEEKERVGEKLLPIQRIV